MPPTLKETALLMTKPAVSAAFAHDFTELDPLDHEEPADDGLDLEAYLDLDDSPDITSLVQGMRDDEAVPPRAAAGPRGADAAGTRGSAGGFGLAARRSRAARLAGDAAHTGTTSESRPRAGRPPSRDTGPAAETERLDARPPDETARPRASHEGAAAFDLAAVARALGEVHVQGRQLVVGCPACDGQASIVVYANRFKCFTCEASGDEVALVRLLTGWDARRVAAWLGAARKSLCAESREVRRPWRLSLFSR